MTDVVREGTEVLERGNIYFFYRPAAGAGTPASLLDVRRFHLVLSPAGTDRLRVLTVGRKRLPEADDPGQRFWGFVKRVGDAGEIAAELGPEGDASGSRQGMPARPAGEGVYAIAVRGNRTHLLYALELPEEPDEVQRELHIEKEGSFLLSVKNPEAGSPPSAGLDEERKAEFPPELQERFGGRRFLPLTPEFLEYEGTELLVMGSEEDPGVELEPEHETEDTSDLLRELRELMERQPVEPLLAGKWA
jgi:hypothetical protein